MRYKESKNFEEWTEWIYKTELERSKHLLKLNKPIDEILQQMADRISKRLEHLIYQQLKSEVEYDVKKCRNDYYENYLKKVNQKN